jgi:hypothetical protein
MTRAKHTTLLLLASALVVAPAITQAAEPPCLTAQEFTALATYALPGVITGVAQRCAATLPADAFLRTGADVLAQRYAAAKPAAWPAAKVAFLKFSAGAQGDMASMLQTLPDATLQQFVDTLSGTIIGQKLAIERCGAVDEVSRLLSPLPPESVSALIAVAISQRGRDGAAPSGKFAICPAPAVDPALAPAPIAVPAPALAQPAAATEPVPSAAPATLAQPSAPATVSAPAASSPQTSPQPWSLSRVLAKGASSPSSAPPPPSAPAQPPQTP